MTRIGSGVKGIILGRASYFNNQYTVLLEKWVHNGYCLAYRNEKPLFVKGGLPGETVVCKILKENAKVAFARVMEVEAAAESRIGSDCRAFPVCGGCSYRHISYPEELKLKREQLAERLRLNPESIRILSGPPEGYRNTVQLHKKGTRLGFYEEYSTQIVPLPDSGCRNLPDIVNKTITGSRFSDGKVYLRFDGNSVVNYKSKGILLTSKGLSFAVPPASFQQTNRFLIEGWIDLLQEYSQGMSPDVVEFFCGIGMISITLLHSGAFESVVGYDSDKNSIRSAKQNSVQLAMKSAEFYVTDLFRKDLNLPISPGKDWIVNPPRQGMSKPLMEVLRRTLPNNLMYSSCDSATLARDSNELEKLGYKITKAALVDFFPRTHHFESVIRFSRSH